jgi:hypothetical protein
MGGCYVTCGSAYTVYSFIKIKRTIIRGCAVEDSCGFRPLEHWDHGFVSLSRHRSASMAFYFALFCVGTSLAIGWPLCSDSTKGRVKERHWLNLRQLPGI